MIGSDYSSFFKFCQFLTICRDFHRYISLNALFCSSLHISFCGVNESDDRCCREKGVKISSWFSLIQMAIILLILNYCCLVLDYIYYMMLKLERYNVVLTIYYN